MNLERGSNSYTGRNLPLIRCFISTYSLLHRYNLWTDICYLNFSTTSIDGEHYHYTPLCSQAMGNCSAPVSPSFQTSFTLVLPPFLWDLTLFLLQSQQQFCNPAWTYRRTASFSCVHFLLVSFPIAWCYLFSLLVIHGILYFFFFCTYTFFSILFLLCFA